MEVAQQTRFETTQGEARSHDVAILLGYSIFAILLLIAIYLNSTSPGAALGDFAAMTVFP
jgi:hypothetical protein